MKNKEFAVVFDRERASSYDTRFAKIAALRDALHLLTRMILSELPTDAHILCVGVGTGSELIHLAEAFPKWRFTAVEPAAPMLDICRRRTEESGIASRCTYHEGYLDSLPASQPFDAATCLLVSHFIMDKEARADLFRQIGVRLRPGGYLVSADLVADMSTSEYRSLLEVWLRMLRYSEMSVEEVERFRDSYGRDVALLPPRTIEAIITDGGFESPVMFLQTLLIHAWYAKRTS